MKYYVYMLIDPVTNLPFYVGKGCGNRWMSHYNETLEKTTNKRKFYKIRKLTKLGHKPKVVFVSEGLSEIDAYKIERSYIGYFGRMKYDENGILTNICLDANPPGMASSDPEGHKRKISRATKGKPKTKEHRKKISDANKGKVKSLEHRIKLGQTHKGKIITSQHREAISKKLTGRKFSPETREKLRIAAIAREERKRNNS